jgi:hypothetical protein
MQDEGGIGIGIVSRQLTCRDTGVGNSLTDRKLPTGWRTPVRRRSQPFSLGLPILFFAFALALALCSP